MAKTRLRKEQEVHDFVQKAKASKATVFVRYSGIPVKQEQELRSELRKGGNSYVAIKKTLIEKAFKELGQSFDTMGDVSGSIAVAFSSTDEASAAKTLKAFSKTAEGMKFVGGLYNNAVISKEEVERLALLPTKEELLAQFVYLVSSPLRGLVQVMNGPARGFVQVLHALQEKKA